MTAPITAVLVDDEELGRALLREHLAAHPGVQIIGECANGFEAVKAVQELRPDILFLDIQMPRLNGFDVVELLEHRPAIVFVTAYDEYAVKAFEVHAVDYLLKPVSRPRFDEALRRAIDRAGKGEAQPLEEVVDAARHRPLERILIKDGSQIRIVSPETIDFIEAQDDYVSIRTEGRNLLKKVTLAKLEEELDPRRFIRIHRSYLLNIDRLARLEPYAKDSRLAVLKDGTKLPVSRTGYAKLKSLM